jgi:hypothetical protein
VNIFSRNATPNTTVKKTHLKDGKVVSESEEHTDEFRSLIKEDGNANVSCSLTKGIDFNSEKVVFHVSVRCDQDEKTMDEAATRVFKKALEYVTEASTALGWNK